MKVLALNGSARMNKGVTARLLGALKEGLEAGGAQYQGFDVAGMVIGPCLACLACMHRDPGVCGQKDQMNQIYDELKQADLLILASPVYLDNMSAQLKTVIDRCTCSMQPFLEIKPDGRVRHPALWRMPGRMLLVSTCGFPEPATFEPMVATFRAEAANFGARTVGELLIPGSIALQIDKTKLDGHLGLLRQAGEVLAQGGELGEPLLARINRPPCSRDQYLELAARYEDWVRKNLAKQKAKAGKDGGQA